MKMKQRESGLVVPAEKPSKPERRYGPLEIREPEARKVASEALLGLWDAMDLSSSGGIQLPGSIIQHEAHRKLYCFIGKMLLGDDCPEKEVLT